MDQIEMIEMESRRVISTPFQVEDNTAPSLVLQDLQNPNINAQMAISTPFQVEDNTAPSLVLQDLQNPNINAQGQLGASHCQMDNTFTTAASEEEHELGHQSPVLGGKYPYSEADTGYSDKSTLAVEQGGGDEPTATAEQCGSMPQQQSAVPGGPVLKSVSHTSSVFNELKGDYRTLLEDLWNITEKKIITPEERKQHRQALQELWCHVEQIQEDISIDLGNGVMVDQKEFLQDLIFNQLFLESGRPDHCALCKREKTKKDRVNSHVIAKTTLKALEQERGGTPVVYSHRNKQLIRAGGVTWYMLCSECETNHQLNIAEDVLERIRQELRNPQCYLRVLQKYTQQFLFAAAFILYRGFMAELNMLCSPTISRFLLSTFYQLKRYCREPTVYRPPPVFFFLLPIEDVFRDLYQPDESADVPLLLDPYMRTIKFTHVATTEMATGEQSFLYSSFDRFHFVIPVTPSKELEEEMVATYPEEQEYNPNLTFHYDSNVSLLKICNEDRHFPPFLYFMSFKGADELRKYCEKNKEYRILIPPLPAVIHKPSQTNPPKRCVREDKKEWKTFQMPVGMREIFTPLPPN